MIIFYGTRMGGTVDGHGGQHAATRFAHIYWMPLFPIGVRWVLASEDKMVTSHPMRVSWRSLAAAYLRTWGVFFGAMGFFFEDALSVRLGALALVLVSLATWWWAKVRGAAARRGRDLFGFATGTFCDPDALTSSMVDSLRSDLDERWRDESPDRTPKDVARFGPKTPTQAALAYAMLRLAARVDRGQGAELRALADKLAESSFETLDTGAGPYRGSAALDTVVEATS